MKHSLISFKTREFYTQEPVNTIRCLYNTGSEYKIIHSSHFPPQRISECKFVKVTKLITLTFKGERPGRHRKPFIGVHHSPSAAREKMNQNGYLRIEKCINRVQSPVKLETPASFQIYLRGTTVWGADARRTYPSLSLSSRSPLNPTKCRHQHFPLPLPAGMRP